MSMQWKKNPINKIPDKNDTVQHHLSTWIREKLEKGAFSLL